MSEAVELRFPAPGRPPSVNRKQHWAPAMRQLRPWREEIGWAWKRLPRAERAKVQGRRCLVSVEIPVPDRRVRDPANVTTTVVKAMVDQLVEQDVWPGDDPRWVRTEEPVFVLKGTEVVVRLTPLD